MVAISISEHDGLPSAGAQHRRQAPTAADGTTSASMSPIRLFLDGAAMDSWKIMTKAFLICRRF